MKFVFKKITEQNIAQFQPYFSRSNTRLCNYSCGIMQMWSTLYLSQVCKINDELVFKGKLDDGRTYFSLIHYDDTDVNLLKGLYEYSMQQNGYFLLFPVPASYLEYIKNSLPQSEQQMSDNWSDYLYDVNSLINLAGGKYDGKRNHIKRFIKENTDIKLTIINGNTLNKKLINPSKNNSDKLKNSTELSSKKSIYCEKNTSENNTHKDVNPFELSSLENCSKLNSTDFMDFISSECNKSSEISITVGSQALLSNGGITITNASSDNIYIKQAIDFIADFGSDIPSGSTSKDENNRAAELFKNLDKLPLVAAVLTVGKKVVGVTCGEIIGDTLHIHIEKADRNYNGTYSYLNNSYAKYMKSVNDNIQFINREEDDGDEGLRRAKESYHPCCKLPKYLLIWDKSKQ